MIPKDFFRVVIKILAILVVINTIIPLLPTIFFFFKSDLSSAFFMLGTVILCFAFIYMMLFQTDVIIRLLNLDKGFYSNKFDFSNIESPYVVKISSAIIGLYLLGANLPYIIYEGFVYFKKNVSSSESIVNDLFDTSDYQLYSSLLFIVVGLILIALRNQISNFFTSKPKENL